MDSYYTELLKAHNPKNNLHREALLFLENFDHKICNDAGSLKRHLKEVIQKLNAVNKRCKPLEVNQSRGSKKGDLLFFIRTGGIYTWYATISLSKINGTIEL